MSENELVQWNKWGCYRPMLWWRCRWMLERRCCMMIIWYSFQGILVKCLLIGCHYSRFLFTATTKVTDWAVAATVGFAHVIMVIVSFSWTFVTRYTNATELVVYVINCCGYFPYHLHYSISKVLMYKKQQIPPVCCWNRHCLISPGSRVKAIWTNSL